MSYITKTSLINESNTANKKNYIPAMIVLIVILALPKCHFHHRQEILKSIEEYQTQEEKLINYNLYGMISGSVKRNKRMEYNAEYLIIEPQIRKQIYPRLVSKDGNIQKDTLKPSRLWEGTFEIVKDTLRITWEKSESGKEKEVNLEPHVIEDYLIREKELFRLSDRKKLVSVHSDVTGLLSRDFSKFAAKDLVIIRARLMACSECNMKTYEKDENGDTRDFNPKPGLPVPGRLLVDGFKIIVESTNSIRCDEECKEKISIVPGAVFQRIPDKLSRLLQEGADPDQAIPDSVDFLGGISGLFFASYMGEVSLAETLIVYGANVNSITKLETTPLMIAAREGHSEMVEFLLKHGADPHKKRQDGTSAIDWSLENEHQQVVSLLESNGASVSGNYSDRAELRSLVQHTCGIFLENIEKIRSSSIVNQMEKVKHYLYEGDIRKIQDACKMVLEKYPGGFHTPYYLFWSAVGNFITGEKTIAQENFRRVLEYSEMDRFHSFAYFAVNEPDENSERILKCDSVLFQNMHFVVCVPDDFTFNESDSVMRVFTNSQLEMDVFVQKYEYPLKQTLDEIIDPLIKVSLDTLEIRGFKAVRFETWKIPWLQKRIRIIGIALEDDTCTYVASAVMPESKHNGRKAALASRIINTVFLIRKP